ncbi:uridine kinase [Paenarthrobacter nicotinovorans]|uniref:uridine kinase n=1 Tax=Paenarthrobacter nicotinovorans TaxID=29320 RepID=UPI0005B9E893|nr:uridine kinase [Paenarthrobacter nicotinovorans]
MTRENVVPRRAQLLQFFAEEVLALGPSRQLIAIDGVDGSGKSTFVEALALAIHGRPVVTIHLDDFLNLQDVRHRRGRASPEGFWLDTYDYTAFDHNVLAPLRNGGKGRIRRAATDAGNNVRIEVEPQLAPDNALVLVEGMFLHRDELVGLWDYSIFLDVPFSETARRMSIRDGSNPDPEHPSMRRYVGGQRIYFENSQPWLRATRIVDNTLPGAPRLLSVLDAMQRQR